MQRRSSVKESLQAVDKLKQSILKKAFWGQLISRDSNDEPASALLERIKVDKAIIKATIIFSNKGKK